MTWKVPEKRPWFAVWPKGIPKTLKYPNIALWEFLIQTSKKNPKHTAIIHNTQRITYKILAQQVDNLAAALGSLGVKKGDRVLLFLPNIPEYIISYYAVIRLGAIVTPVNPLAKEGEFNYVFSSVEPAVIVVHAPLYPITAPSLTNFSEDKVLVVESTETPAGTQPFEALLTNSKAQLPQIDFIPAEDTAVIQFTGGTTGMPKGTMLTHFNLVANALQNVKWFNWTKEDVMMGTLPLCHSWGACCNMNSTIMVGATLLLVTRFIPEIALEAIQTEKVTCWYGPPTLFTLLVNHPTLTNYDLSSLRYVKIGAAPIPEEIRRQWEHLTGVKMILGYGLTEASPETLSSPPDDIRPGTVGIPIIDTDAMIVDLETGSKEILPGETGELIVRGPQVMKGYWKDPDQTRHSLRNGWLYTGDLARIDEDGYFLIVDRLKNTIKYKGYSVFPAELENLLYSHPAVKECCVVGKPDAFTGEIPKAFIVLKEGYNPTKEELIEYCKERIAPYKRIREVEFVDSLPKTAVGKILARELREQERRKFQNSKTE
ncbi:MAG: class I adenylate-forming enzyme family protein [Candidatus Heimdallarchaeota archaeon]